MSHLSRTLVACALVASFAGTASAQSARYHPVIRPGTGSATPLGARAFEHSAFGQIARMGSGGFVMRLRSGRMLVVDASAAMASGRFSAPLFVGKLVVVTGGVDSRGTFLAQTVTRMTHIDKTTRADR